MHRHIGTHLKSKARQTNLNICVSSSLSPKRNNSFTALPHMTSFTSSAQFLLLIKNACIRERCHREGLKMKEKERKVGGGQLLEGGLLSRWSQRCRKNNQRTNCSQEFSLLPTCAIHLHTSTKDYFARFKNDL